MRYTASVEEMRETLAHLTKHHGRIADAARDLGIPRTTYRDRVLTAQTMLAKRGEIGGPPIPEAGRPPEGFGVFRNSASYDGEGNLERQWVETRRERGEEYTVPAGHTVKGESALIDPDGRIIARWIKTREGASTDDLVVALKEAFSSYDGKAAKIPAPKFAEDDLLTVYPLPDLHLGAYSWSPETGDDYDVDLAVSMATANVGTLIAQSRPSTRAVLLGLGDYFHANDARAVTPTSGHRLDVDGRWSRVFAAGAKLATTIVDLLARKHAQVEVVFLPGNHDIDAAMSLTVALALFYSSNPRISVHQEPGIAWFCRFGSVLLGASHGHTMKPDKMAMLLASDRAEDWGETKHRHFMFGHVHHQSVTEVGPVRVESFSSPAARDAWNAAAGYRATRGLSAITYHREEGEIGRHKVNITNTRPKVRVAAGGKS